MNEKILDLIKTYPKGGGYTWDKLKNNTGVPEDIVYQGQLLLKKDTSTYCSGLCFHVWFRLVGSTLDIPFSEMRKVQRLFYNAADNRRGAQDALTAIRMGVPVAPNDAKAGDFLQLWRVSKSGHSVIFLRQDKEAGTITYWSTQPKTDGIGERTEFLVAMSEMYFVRALEAEPNL
jgi:hypothetical protein